MVRLTPHRFRLGLDTALGAEDGHAAGQNAQAALHLGGEVDMARRIDDVDARILPEADVYKRQVETPVEPTAPTYCPAVTYCP